MEIKNGRLVTDGRTCHYCLEPINTLTRTRDHIVPRSLGGLDVRWNITWSCRKCNSNKASTWPVCRCSVCRKTIRKHWEMKRLRDPAKDKAEKS